MAELLSALRPLVVWMSNALELLNFIQHQLPPLLAWRSRREQQEVGEEEEDSWKWAMIENDFCAPKPLLTEVSSQLFKKCDRKLFTLYD